MTRRSPAYQWYPGDADTDEVYRLMTYEQEGVYRRLLDHQWMEGSIPADPDVLASLVPKMPRDRFVEIWPFISKKFRALGNDRLINDRLEFQRKERDRFARSQKANADKRWHPKKIEPKIGNAMALPTTMPSGKALALPSQCSSSSSSSSSKCIVRHDAPDGTQAFLTWFQAEYKTRRNGAVYFVRWEAHGALVKRLLKGIPFDRLKQHAQVLLHPNTDAADEWIAGTDHGIEVLSAKINWLEERLCAWETKRKAREAV